MPMETGKEMRPHGRKRRKVCTFCADKVEHIDYKDAGKLKKFLSTGTCAMHQRELTVAVKRARQIALLPYVTD